MNSQRNSGVNSVGTAVKAKCIKVQGEICKSLARTSAPLRTSSINDGGHIKLFERSNGLKCVGGRVRLASAR